MSEQQNVESVKKMYDAFGKGDIPYILDQLTDDVRWLTHFDPVVPWSGNYPGKADTGRFFQAIGDSVDVTSFTPDEYVAQGETVVSTGTFGCKVKATGKDSLTPWVFIWKFRDGKVTSYEQYHDAAIANAFR